MRKFTHNNHNYEYVVGRKFVKVVNRDTSKSVLVPKEKISKVTWDCEFGCNSTPEVEDTACPHAFRLERVTPSCIRELIKQEKI